MTTGVTIRLARDDELEAAGRLVADAYRTQPGMDEAGGYLDQVRDARGRAGDADILVAVDDDGTLLGCVSYVRDHASPLAELELPDEAGFRMLGVAVGARGRGVGASLVDACAARARTAGRRGLAITTEPSWTTAQRLYERLGFQRAPARDFEPVPGVRLWAYTLAL